MNNTEPTIFTKSHLIAAVAALVIVLILLRLGVIS